MLDLDVTAVDRPLLAFGCDVTDAAGVDAAVATAAGELGGIDVVVANAGIGAQGTVADNDDDEWRRLLDVNVLGVGRTVRTALPFLRQSSAAAVVVTASIASWAGLPQRALYSASKGALAALTLAMAADHVREGIRVNAVAPGTADTPWVGRLLAATADPAAERAALEARPADRADGQPRGGRLGDLLSRFAAIGVDDRDDPRRRRRDVRPAPAPTS